MSTLLHNIKEGLLSTVRPSPWGLFRTYRAASGDAGNYLGGPIKLVLHSTEIPQHPWPDWISRWSSPSHVVCDPVRKDTVQCLPLNKAGKALLNLPGGVQTNFDGAIQVEINMFAVVHGDPARPDLLDDQYEYLGRQLALIVLWARAYYGEGTIDYWDTRPPGAIPGSARASAPQRMSFSEWDNFGGMCQHRHVPENDHWDAGELDLYKLAAIIDKYVNPSPAHYEEEDEMIVEHPTVRVTGLPGALDFGWLPGNGSKYDKDFVWKSEVILSLKDPAVGWRNVTVWYNGKATIVKVTAQSTVWTVPESGRVSIGPEDAKFVDVKALFGKAKW